VSPPTEDHPQDPARPAAGTEPSGLTGSAGRTSGPRARNRPLQAISTLVLALAAAAGVHLEGVPLGDTTASEAARLNSGVSIGAGHLITIAGTAVFFIFALISTFAFARWARSVLERLIGAAYGAIVRYVMILVGICVIALVTLSMLGFRVAQLVVGGAVTGVLITIAAQQSLSNLFAGVMLQFAHPFRVGDQVRISAGALGGTIEGVVAEFSITYVRLETASGRVYLPNAQVLAAAVSPVRSASEQDSPGGGQAAQMPGATGFPG
jgi:small-conductance mechanosensitive channel